MTQSPDSIAGERKRKIGQPPANWLQIALSALSLLAVAALWFRIEDLERSDRSGSSTKTDALIKALEGRLEASEAAMQRLQEEMSEVDKRAKATEELSLKLHQQVSLMKNFRNSVPLAVVSFCDESQSSCETLLKKIAESEEVFAISVAHWAIDADTLFGRLAKKEELREKAYAAVSTCLDEHVMPLINTFVAERHQSWRRTLKNLLLPDWETEFPPAPSDTFCNVRGIDETIDYLNSNWQKIGKLAEEGATWIPLAGDAYDLSRLKYNWRESNILEPRADRAADEIVTSLEERILNYTARLNDYVLASKVTLLSAHSYESILIAYQTAMSE